MKQHNFISTDALDEEFCEKLIAILKEAIDLRGHAYLVVSGGKTPQTLFCLLSKASIDWSAVTVVLADERRIPTDHVDSNERFIHEFLLKNAAKKANYISLSHHADGRKASESEIESAIHALPHFDVVILGMGLDGHTASLFPCSPEIQTGLHEKACSTLIVHPKTAPYERISMTYARLCRSRHVFLHIVGEGKRHVLQQAIDEQDPLKKPIAALIAAPDVDLQVMYAPG